MLKKHLNLFKTTLIGGIFFLVPFAVLIMVLGKVFKLALRVIMPLAELIPMESAIGLKTPWILATILLLVVCLLAGLVAKTKLAARLINWLEATVLYHLPGYSFMKGVGEELAGNDPSDRYPAVLVRSDDCSQLGVLVETLKNDQSVVYIPGAPRPWDGAVLIVENSRVTPLTKSSKALVNCLNRLGEGVEELLPKDQ